MKQSARSVDLVLISKVRHHDSDKCLLAVIAVSGIIEASVGLLILLEHPWLARNDVSNVVPGSIS